MRIADLEDAVVFIEKHIEMLEADKEKVDPDSSTHIYLTACIENSYHIRANIITGGHFLTND
jgi:hypothetical protein